MKAPIQAFVAAAASFIAVSIIYIIIYCVCKSRKKKTSSTTWTPRSIPNKPRSVTSFDESTTFDPSLRISMEELREATKNFSPELIVGDGSFGYVYRARLSDGLTVAIKKLDPNAFQGFREFGAEMGTLGKLDHPNVVKLLGYCTSTVDRLLVYEYMEKGSLDQWLYDSFPQDHDIDFSASYHSLGGLGGEGGTLERKPLSWSTRIKITRGIACGLAYLHGLPTQIIHRDIKASNVLLDKEFEAHISDFGLARKVDASHSHVSTQVAGTMGYMPPEYREGNTAATVLADVYSFGILMFEIGSGRRPNLPVPNEGSHVCLIDWARNMVEQKKELKMVDSDISEEDLDEEEVREYFRIAIVCTTEAPKDRPSMAKVVELLRNVAG